MIINLQEIKELIPHRDPFLFVDKCEIIEPGKKGISERLFSENEYFFEGHFPSNPIVPGVIIVEAMAQTAGIVVSYQFKDIKDKSHMYFVHSYEFVPTDKNFISATTDYSSKHVCAVEKENIFGTQFHPEKSDKIGLKIIDNFIKI